jgi:hypothetical protein
MTPDFNCERGGLRLLHEKPANTPLCAPHALLRKYYPRSDFKAIPYIPERVDCKLFHSGRKAAKGEPFLRRSKLKSTSAVARTTGGSPCRAAPGRTDRRSCSTTSPADLRAKTTGRAGDSYVEIRIDGRGEVRCDGEWGH